MFYGFTEVAKIVLNQCIESHRDPRDNNVQMTFDFEFLDDFLKLPPELEAEWERSVHELLQESGERSGN